MDALRFAAEDDATIEGWAVPFDGHLAGGKDSYQTRFSARTNYALDWYPSRPAMFQHGLDPDTGLVPVGTIRSLEIRETGGPNNKGGVWMKAVLDKQHRYFDEIRQMVEAGKLYLSSGSVEHLVKIDARTGDVTQWPIVEVSLTSTPANLFADIPVRNFRAAVRTALPNDLSDEHTIVHDPLRAVWSTAAQNDFPDSSFAYVESGEKDGEGKTTPRSNRHLVYKNAKGEPDASHVRNALARLDQTDIPDAAKASARKKLVAAAKELGIEVADDADDGDGDGKRSADAVRAKAADEAIPYEKSFEDIRDDIARLLNPQTPFPPYPYVWNGIIATYPGYVIVCRSEDGEGESYWKILYTLDDTQEPVLGAATEMETVFIPAATRTSTGPLSLESQSLIRHAAALAARTQDLGERRYREGRMLSAPNLKTLDDAADALETHAQRIRDLTTRARGQAAEAARAALFADPAARRHKIALLDL